MSNASASNEPDSQSLLEVLGQSYVLDILNATAGGAQSVREIAREADVPTTTLYRRLDDLVDAALLDETMHIDSDGDHYRVYQSLLKSLKVTTQDGGVSVDVNFADNDRVQEPTVALSAT